MRFSLTSAARWLGAMALVPGFTLLAGCTDDKGGVDDTEAPAEEFDLDGDGYASPTDCDDASAAISPGAPETCNGFDDDCDGQTDEYGVADGTTWYPDSDGDTFGDPNTPVVACSQPEGTVADNTDCDDANAESTPAATEICDGLDNDCDGETDEDGASGGIQVHADADGDTFGDPEASLVVCSISEGYVADDSDCDDTDDTINPLASEICDDTDNNCDGEVDGSNAIDAETWYEDSDGDGYGLADSTELACSKPTGYARQPEDCDDDDRNINPGERERCNGDDDNCDGITDTDAYNASTWYYDEDGDGYGLDDVTVTQCDAPSEDYVLVGGDCDDENDALSPGETEVCFDTDGLDNNCDGYADAACYYGMINYQEGFSRTAGERDCSLWWDTTWQPISSICDDCEYSFEVSFVVDEDSSTGSCYSGISEDETWELGVDFNYMDTDYTRVWYTLTYDYYDYEEYEDDIDVDYAVGGSSSHFSYTMVVPWFDATYYEATGKLIFSEGLYDYPYREGRRTYYLTDWTYGYVYLGGE